MVRLLCLELNEINFGYVRFYADRGALPHFADLIDRHGIAETTSESRYEELLQEGKAVPVEDVVAYVEEMLDE